jgi:hypothetical protein
MSLVSTPIYQIPYKVIAKEFINLFYSIYDNNYEQLRQFFVPAPILIFCDSEFYNMDQLIQTWKNNRIDKFQHYNSYFCVIPLGNYGILISAYGNIYWNNQSYTNYRYCETIVLTNNIYQPNTYSVTHYSFQLIR